MPRIILIDDDDVMTDVTAEVSQILDDNSELFEQLEEVQLSQPNLSLARGGRGAQTMGTSPDVSAASRPKGRLAARPAGSSAAQAAKAAGNPTMAATKGGSLAGGGRATTLGKKVMHAGKLAVRFGKKHPAVAAAAGGFAGAAAANSLRNKMKLSNDALQLDTELLEEEVLFDDLSPEEQDEYIESLTDDEAEQLFASLPEDEQAEAIAEIRAEQLNDFAANVLAGDAEGRTPKKK